jgi:hypothetical protein
VENGIEYCVQAYAWCGKSAYILTPDEWIKREWPKLIAEFLPEDTYNADNTGLHFRAMVEHTLLFKNERANGFKPSR